MTRLGTILPGQRGCVCESPSLDSLGTPHLRNDGTYRVWHCQRCGGAYDAQRDGDPVPGTTMPAVWRCPRCQAVNFDLALPGCTNCNWVPDPEPPT